MERDLAEGADLGPLSDTLMPEEHSAPSLKYPRGPSFCTDG